VSAAVVTADWQAAGRLAEISTAMAKEQRKAFRIVMVLFPSVNEMPRSRREHTKAQEQQSAEGLLLIVGECTADIR
jgi:hypothetical protein